MPHSGRARPSGRSSSSPSRSELWGYVEQANAQQRSNGRAPSAATHSSRRTGLSGTTLCPDSAHRPPDIFQYAASASSRTSGTSGASNYPGTYVFPGSSESQAWYPSGPPVFHGSSVPQGRYPSGPPVFHDSSVQEPQGCYPPVPPGHYTAQRAPAPSYAVTGPVNYYPSYTLDPGPSQPTTSNSYATEPSSIGVSGYPRKIPVSTVVCDGRLPEGTQIEYTPDPEPARTKLKGRYTY